MCRRKKINDYLQSTKANKTKEGRSSSKMSFFKFDLQLISVKQFKSCKLK